MTVVSPTRSTETAANEPLLAYTVSTSPDPLKASPENPQAPEEKGELQIVGSRHSGTPADVQWIRVKVPAGPMSPDLATDLAKITPRISLSGWSVRLDSAAKEFVFSPSAGHAPIGADTGFTIQLSEIPVNRKVGTSPITITESSRTGSSAFQPRSTTFNVGKFPADFYLRNLICTPLVIDNGGEVTLTWERSANATYELLYGDTNLDVTKDTSKKITNVKSDTTFYLRGTTGDASNPVVRILAAQVSVKKPDLEIGNLIVHGTTRLNGAATTRDLTVNTANTLHVRTIEGSGAYGSLAIGGRLTLSTEGREVNVASKFTVAGTTQLNGATTTKNLTVDPGADGYLWLKTGRLDTAPGTNLNAYGTVGIIKNGVQALHSGYISSGFRETTYRANGDGFLTLVLQCLVYSPYNGWQALNSYFTAYATTAGVTRGISVPQVQVQGSRPASSQMSVPVAKGGTVKVSLDSAPISGGGGNGYFSVYWTPLGGGPNLTQATAAEIAEQEEQDEKNGSDRAEVPETFTLDAPVAPETEPSAR
ncbi:hypothetical protein [Streptomyces tubercidicus]|uniref:Uncharacterized protein n=1 Tax=Streptomyces tubercidicus TaxID=47759 RepID=A0A640UR88_9ACTN|nr:hypothetical protein [Streptomyces tubercidicus]WAU12528.1 hypothetical protein STRTU_002889 [Streptomyces tubercidicus]GFE37980.1 hypothetical protein Stube_26530 [Streptomyces tubercidicus]